jgi:hypothetical protein
MESASTLFARENASTTAATANRGWQRILLLFIIAYEAAGCLAGGIMLAAEPDGRLMVMPVEILNGAFKDFFIPGLILVGLGVLNTLAFFHILRKTRLSWIMAALALGGLNIWFWIEIAILGEIHWLHLMWGAPVLIATALALPLVPDRANLRRRLLLLCGVIASALYIVINLVVAAQWPEFDTSSMTVSELSAVGAPTRRLWMVLCTPYSVLMIAFAFGVLMSAFGNRRIRLAGWLLVVYGVTGAFWPFAPMHLREDLASGEGTFSDTMHLILAAVTQVIFFTSLALVATELGKTFRWYSVATVLILLVFGVLTFLESPGISTNQPTPYIGVWERINIGVFILWVIVVAFVLSKRKEPAIGK